MIQESIHYFSERFILSTSRSIALGMIYLLFCLEFPNFSKRRGVRFTKIVSETLGCIKHATSRTASVTSYSITTGLCPTKTEILTNLFPSVLMKKKNTKYGGCLNCLWCFVESILGR